MYKALKTFTCKNFAMHKGQEKEIEDIDIINDLLNVGYIEKVEESIEEPIEEVVEELAEEIVETEEVETEIKEEVEKPKKTTSKNKK